MSVLREISEERDRQLRKGYDAEHDDKHTDYRLLLVATCICNKITWPNCRPVDDWGIIAKWKNSTRKMLIIAIALLVAEVERLDRIENKDISK